MARPTKIRNAKTAEDFRDAVVERWHKIWCRALPPSSVDGSRERPLGRRVSSSGYDHDDGPQAPSVNHDRQSRVGRSRPRLLGHDDDD